MMAAILTLTLLLALCTLPPSIQQNNLLTPSFQLPTDTEATRPVPSVNSFDENRVYRPTYPTVFYQTSGNTLLKISLTLRNVMGHLDSLSAWSFEIRYKCNPNSTELMTDTAIDRKPIVICNSVISDLPISIHFSVENILNNSTCTISYRIQRKAVTHETIPDPLNYFQSLWLFIRGNKWILKTAPIFLKLWLWPSKMFAMDFITKDSEKFLLSMKPSNSPPVYLSKQFLTPYASNLLRGLTELTKSLLSIGVLMQLNTGGFLMNREHIRLMTDNYPKHIDSLDMRFMRIDWETGIMYYSPNGLRRVVDDLVQKSKEKKLCSEEAMKDIGCAVVVVVNLLYHSLLPQDVRYSVETEVIQKGVKDDTYSTDDSWRFDKCSVLPSYSKSVTVFSGVKRTILCPIICSQPETLYAFYKGSEPLPASPYGMEEFSRYGSVLVHKSGAAIRFDTNATYVDSGKYNCIAGDQKATFQVDVVTLPSFNVTNTALTGGYLPPKIFVFEGDDYSLSCTVFHSGMENVTLRISLTATSTSVLLVNLMLFRRLFTKYDTKVELSKTYNKHSSTATISVTNVPPFKSRFHHNCICIATISNKDEQRFESPGFSIHTETSVFVLERPKLSDFIIKYKNCCRTECILDVCKIEISLRPDLLIFLNTLGITVHANFINPVELLESRMKELEKKHSAFKPANASLTWSMNKGINQMVNNDAILFTSLIPVFKYENPMAYWGGQHPTFSITPHRVSTKDNKQMAATCLQNKTCVYSTVMNQPLTDALKVSTLLGVVQKYELDFTKAVIEKDGFVIEKENVTEKERQRIIDVFEKNNSRNDNKKESLCVSPNLVTPCTATMSILFLLLI